VETADAANLFDAPHHPYTEALLKAIPRLHEPPHARLAAIDGAPPDMVNPPVGCRFAPRCRYAQDDCRQVPPFLDRATPEIGTAPAHSFACYHPVKSGGH
jgi:peptide/nickel transport system ATP-binding protein